MNNTSANPNKKSAARLAVRIKDYEETISKLGPSRSRGFRKPGSNRK